MEITEVRIRPVDENKLKAYCSITIDDSLVIRDIKIVTGKKGLFLSMPSRKRRDGTFQDIAHPINADFRKKIEEVIFKEYVQVTDGKGLNGDSFEEGQAVGFREGDSDDGDLDL